MVKDQVYIRSFTSGQKTLLEHICVNHGLTTGKAGLLFALEAYTGHENEIARLKRLLDYKQRKIERLNDELLKTQCNG